MAVSVVEEVDQEPARVIRFTPPEDVRPQDAPPEEPAPPPARPVKVVRNVDFPTAEVLAVLTLMLKVLSTRIILALAGCGAFALAFLAINSNSLQAILTAGIYDLCVFAPCLFLAIRREA